jgi:hypothetical protein
MGRRARRRQQEAFEELWAEVARLREMLDGHGSSLDAQRLRSSEIADRLGEIETRVGSLGGELSRQLHELSTELDQLTAKVADDDTATRLAEIRESQIRLATEQARYEYAFREDLARLADELRRG